MSLYRQAGGPSRRALLVAAAAALAAGLAAGFIAGRGSAPEAELSELATEARASVRPAASALELVGIEYPEAVRGEEDVVKQTEYQAAVDQAKVAGDTIAAADDLRLLDPGALARAEAAVEAVAESVGAVADPRELAPVLAEAQRAVEALTADSGQQ